jgi:hypothetical protein
MSGHTNFILNLKSQISNDKGVSVLKTKGIVVLDQGVEGASGVVSCCSSGTARVF